MRFRRRHRLSLFVASAVVLGAAGFSSRADARLDITIDKSSQRMTVALDDLEIFNWPVSTGVRGYDTPSGEYKPFRMERHHFSREWDDAPMPHSIFFTQRGHAIHGTGHLRSIGRPASHGCVRLAPDNAAMLFKLVKQEGMANTRVALTGEAPDSAPAIAGLPGDQDFTAALPAERRDRAGIDSDPNAPAFYDGRHYYNRRGRRYSGPVYREFPRAFRHYYQRGGGPFWWGLR